MTRIAGWIFFAFLAFFAIRTECCPFRGGARSDAAGPETVVLAGESFLPAGPSAVFASPARPWAYKFAKADSKPAADAAGLAVSIQDSRGAWGAVESFLQERGVNATRSELQRAVQLVLDANGIYEPDWTSPDEDVAGKASSRELEKGFRLDLSRLGPMVAPMAG